eukprot:TRINITY_DN1346_c0_g1_i1.p1 TRINITY_DN1346_c0_g1~~TRINITY_DN1346_c0_g1_i1.p1  ORF type:complete len:477 (+),score=12.43 TRINITY_DN1346_c0_g1_i1:465-1895(+)
MATGGKVEVKTCCMIKPSVATLQQRFFLSNFDFLFLRFNNVKRLLFYSLSPPIEVVEAQNFRDTLIKDLKESLSKTLVKFFPLAGRLHKSDDGRYEIDCNDKGVAFVEAESNVEFKDLQNEDFSHRDFFEDLVRHHGDAEAPFLSVQVTFFGGLKGMCIGTTLRHVVADGRSFWNFMKFWSRICRRSTNLNIYEAVQDDDEPFHDRRALQFPDHPADDVTHSFRASKTGRAKLLTFVPTSARSDDKDQCKIPNEKRQTHSKEDGTAIRRFHLQEQDLLRLKTKAPPGTSTFVALAAHFWRSVVRTHEASCDSEVLLLLLVDLRHRMQTAFPRTYFGNCVSFGVVVTTAGDLLEKEDDMSFAVELVKEAVEMSVEEEFLVQFNRWLARPEKMDKFMSAESPFQSCVCRVNVVSSPRFEVYETDFGWERPERVQACDYDNLGCMILFCGRDDNRSIDLWTRLRHHQLEGLLQVFYGLE